jgi:hypothetical protein
MNFSSSNLVKNWCALSLRADTIVTIPSIFSRPFHDLSLVFMCRRYKTAQPGHTFFFTFFGFSLFCSPPSSWEFSSLTASVAFRLGSWSLLLSALGTGAEFWSAADFLLVLTFGFFSPFFFGACFFFVVFTFSRFLICFLSFSDDYCVKKKSKLFCCFASSEGRPLDVLNN